MSEQTTTAVPLIEAVRTIPGVADDRVALEVAARVEDKSPLARKAFELWWEARREELATEPAGEVVHRFQSAEVHEQVVNFHVADVTENVAILQLRLAQQRRSRAIEQFQSALVEHDLFFRSDGDQVQIHRGEIRRLTKAQRLEAIRQLVEFTKHLAMGDAAVTPEEALNGKLPENLRKYPVKDFTTEIGDFIVRTGDEGRELICRICDDKTVAQEVEDHPDSPRVLKQLADWSKQLHAAAPRISAKPAQLGFAAA